MEQHFQTSHNSKIYFSTIERKCLFIEKNIHIWFVLYIFKGIPLTDRDREKEQKGRERYIQILSDLTRIYTVNISVTLLVIYIIVYIVYYIFCIYVVNMHILRDFSLFLWEAQSRILCIYWQIVYIYVIIDTIIVYIFTLKWTSVFGLSERISEKIKQHDIVRIV